MNVYTWDRANRLLTAPGSTSYQYDSLGNRIQQTVDSVVTNYLLDTQPGLAVVLQQTTNSNIERFIHSSRGIHAHQNPSGDWFYPLQDGLGSVRSVSDDMLTVQGMQHYEPYGSPFGVQGNLGMPYGFTGEQTDANDLVYLRARYLSPGLGVFASLDPFEGMAGSPMSLNGFGYVSGNPVNLVDYNGMCAQPTQWWNPIDVNCYYSAVGLAQRFSQDNPQTYDQWFDVLIKQNWEYLKALEVTGSAADVTGSSRQFLNNAAIIPRLFRENPQAALAALQQFGCQNQGTILDAISITMVASAQAIPWSNQSRLPRGNQPGTGLGIGLAMIGGVIVAVGGLILWDELTQPATNVITQSTIGELNVRISREVTRARDRAITHQPGCPEPCRPSPRVQIDRVPPSRPHFPCPGDHYTVYIVSQSPPPECKCRTTELLGGCLEQDGVPNEPYDIRRPR